MKKRGIVIGVIVGAVVIAASGIAYGILRKPKSSEELALKAVQAMSNVKSFDIDGNIDAEASVGSHISLPADVTFDGNYNIEDYTGLINYTAKTTVFGHDFDYSNQLDLSADADSDSDKESSPAESTTESLSEDSTDVEIDEAAELLKKSEFKYNKKDQTYSIILKMEDIIAIEPIEKTLLGEGSLLKQIGITEKQFYDALDDNAEVELTFDSKYFLSEIAINSMDIEKDINLKDIGLGNVSAKVSFETDIHLSNYQ